jgi:general secretion pathway protein D
MHVVTLPHPRRLSAAALAAALSLASILHAQPAPRSGPVVPPLAPAPTKPGPAAPLPGAAGPASTPASPPAPAPAPVTLPATGNVSFQALPETVEIKALLDYLAQRLGINIMYDDRDVANATITIKAPAEIPADQVLPLIESMLRLKGLALIDAPVPGWKRVVPIGRLAEAGGAIVGPQAPAPSGTAYVTRLIPLKFDDPSHMKTVLTPFITSGSGGPGSPTPGGPGGGNIEIIANQKALMITDAPANIARIQAVIDLLDRPNPTQIRFIPARNAEARTLARQVSELMTAKAQSEGLAATRDFKILADERSNQIIVLGPATDLDTAAQLLASLDTPIQRDANPVQSYLLANTTADDVLATIQRLEGEEGLQSLVETRPNEPGSPGSSTTAPSGSVNEPAMQPGLGEPSSLLPRPQTSGRMDTALTPPASRNRSARSAGVKTPGGARITADVHTNSIIVIAPPQVQKVYEALIKMLDRRRPQVLVEVMLVTLDTTDDFTLGVDIGSHAGNKPTVLNFSQYGVSVANPSAGTLTLPATLAGGYTGAILGAGNLDIVINALKTSTRAHIASAPRMLVNDNAEAKLSSIAEEPYQTSVLTNTSVASQSFGGFEKAGTIVKVEPHISEDDYLQLKYEIELSSFIGARSGGLPPARRTDVTSSVATIPDGSTIIVGGINNDNKSETINRIPILGEIPILEYAFSKRADTTSRRTFFVFIRPIILRDREFQDLRYLSGQDAKSAKVKTDYPTSKPQLMR